jgi:hypothetical protein
MRGGKKKLRKSTRPMDGMTGVARTVDTSILWGWMAPCSLQRRPNGAKILMLFMAPREWKALLL